MTPIMVHRDRWYTEKGLEFPADTDGPGAISDLTVTSWDADPPTTADLSWTVPEDIPEANPTLYEVKAFPVTDSDPGEWPGWDHATIILGTTLYTHAYGETETATVSLPSRGSANSWLICIRSTDVDSNVSLDGNLAALQGEPPVEEDTTPPDAVDDINVPSDPYSGIQWTIPYDQPDDANPVWFEVRVIFDAVGSLTWDADTWAAATQLILDVYSGWSETGSAGETCTISDVDFASRYSEEGYLCYCVRSNDAADNWSTYSNSAEFHVVPE